MRSEIFWSYVIYNAMHHYCFTNCAPWLNWLQGVTGGCKKLQRVKGGDKGLQGVTRGYRVLQGVTRGYRVLQGVTRG